MKALFKSLLGTRKQNRCPHRPKAQPTPEARNGWSPSLDFGLTLHTTCVFFNRQLYFYPFITSSLRI